MAFVKINDTILHYQYLDFGKQETIVFINSLGTNFQIWNGLVPALSGHYNLLLQDKRGHGLSLTSESTPSIDDYADDVVGIMNHCSIAKAHIVGLSIGGMITYSLASRYSDRCDKLIFSNTGAKIGTPESWNERIQSIQKDGLKAMSATIIERWLSPTYRQNNAAATQGYIRMLESNTTLGYIQACAAIGAADYTPILDKIKHPIMFIGGSEDLGTTPAFVQENAQNIGAERIEIIDRVGHLPCIEKPEKIANLIHEFCSTNPNLTLYEQGMKTRRSILGNAHVDRVEANKTDFDKDFQTYIINSAWGSIWSRPGLSKRDRSLITIALLAALGHEEELAMHIRATKNTGATADEVKETLLHTGIYAGVPVTNGAMKIAKSIFLKKKENE